VQLETDEALLVPKARGALKRYGHRLVIGMHAPHASVHALLTTYIYSYQTARKMYHVRLLLKLHLVRTRANPLKFCCMPPGNLLHTRKYHVKFVTNDTDEDIVLTDDQKKDDVEIEVIIIDRLAAMHAEFIKGGH
jgi:hypothetical protein